MGGGRHIEYLEYVLTEADTNTTEALDYIAHLIYTTALFICRMSGLALYFRLCRHHTVLSLATNVGAGLLIAAFLPQLFLLIFHCRPATILWPYDWKSTFPNYACLLWGQVYLVNSSLSLFCDCVLFILPIFMIRSLQMSRQKKINLSFVLLPGVV